jgi:hydroxymethylbilane synthase
MTAIRIGTRGSALALWQARHVAARIREAAPDVVVELVEIASTGDRITDVPLADVEGTGFFTATLERALADGRVDVAVHSYKDLPVDHTPGLVVAAVPPRGPVEDVLCVSPTLSTQSASSAAVVSPSALHSCSFPCSSDRHRRWADRAGSGGDRTSTAAAALGNCRRISRLTSGELDAIVLARAGLVQLGLSAYSDVSP